VEEETGCEIQPNPELENGEIDFGVVITYIVVGWGKLHFYFTKMTLVSEFDD
jgi:hypothetical protein